MINHKSLKKVTEADKRPKSQKATEKKSESYRKSLKVIENSQKVTNIVKMSLKMQVSHTKRQKVYFLKSSSLFSGPARFLQET